jgi:SAM-dependent methyltransferase
VRNPEAWVASKYVTRAGALRPATAHQDLSVASRIVGSLVADFYATAVPAYARGHLADLGCGTVPLYGTYRAHVAGVTTVDWPGSVHHAVYTDVFADLGDALPFRDATFDTVLLSDVLEHLPRPERAVGEIFRVLRPGGVLMMNVPFLYPIHEAPHDYCRHTRYSLTMLATTAGFVDVEVTELGDVLDVVADLLAKTALSVPLAGRWIARLVAAVMVRSRRIRGRSAALRRASAAAPLGYGMVARRPS